MQCLRLKPRVNDTRLRAFASGHFCQSAASLVRPISFIVGVFSVPCAHCVEARMAPVLPTNRGQKAAGSLLQVATSMVHHPPPPALSVWGTNSAIPSHLAFEFFIVSGPVGKSRSLSLSRFCLSRLQLSLDPLQISTKLSRKKLRTTNSPDISISSPSLFLSIGIHPAVCRPYRSYTAQEEGNEWPIIQPLALDRYASAATGRCHPISR